MTDYLHHQFSRYYITRNQDLWSCSRILEFQLLYSHPPGHWDLFVLTEVIAQIWLDPSRVFWGCWATLIKNFFQFQWSKVFCSMYGLTGIEVMTLSGYLSHIDEIFVLIFSTEKKESFWTNMKFVFFTSVKYWWKKNVEVRFTINQSLFSNPHFYPPQYIYGIKHWNSTSVKTLWCV